MVTFYDTNTLINFFQEERTKIENIEGLKNVGFFAISSITIEELEKMKKYATIGYTILKYLAHHQGKYDIVIHKSEYERDIAKKCDTSYFNSNDIKILSDALWYDRNIHPDETIFSTSNFALAQIANLFYGEDMIQYIFL